jgi:hypothetical protein
MMMRLTFLPALSVVLATCGSAYAAEISTERTSMPDFCSGRDVTCVLRDGQPRLRAAAPRNSSTAEPSDSPQLVLTPSQAPSTRAGATASPIVNPDLRGTNPAVGAGMPRTGNIEAGNSGAASGAAATGRGRVAGDRVAPR